MDILVQPINRVIAIQPGANPLQALQEAQVPVSYSCMSGRCGTCRCRVIDGAVMAGEGQARGPLDAGPGWVLACQIALTGPCTVEIAESDEVVVHPARIVKATVAAIENVTHDIQHGQEWLAAMQRVLPRLRVHVVVSAGGDPAAQRCGLVTDAIEQDHGSLSGWRAYLCGSPPMVEDAAMLARRLGVTAEHIHADAFFSQGT